MRAFDLPEKFSNPKRAKIALLPVPYDGTSTYGKGADKGPKALLTASQYVELYDIETKTEVYKHGIYAEKSVTEKRTPQMLVSAVEKRISELLRRGKFCVLLGGEHSVTPGSARAHAREYKKLSVL